MTTKLTFVNRMLFLLDYTLYRNMYSQSGSVHANKWSPTTFREVLGQVWTHSNNLLRMGKEIGRKRGWLSMRLLVKVNACCTHTEPHDCFSKSKVQGEISAVSWKYAHLHFLEREVLLPRRTEEFVYWEERDEMGVGGRCQRVTSAAGWKGENIWGWGLFQWEEVDTYSSHQKGTVTFFPLRKFVKSIDNRIWVWMGWEVSVSCWHPVKFSK